MISLFFSAEYDAIMCIYHILVILLPVVGYLGCLHFLVVVNRAAMIWMSKCLCGKSWSLWGCLPRSSTVV